MADKRSHKTMVRFRTPVLDIPHPQSCKQPSADPSADSPTRSSNPWNPQTAPLNFSSTFSLRCLGIEIRRLALLQSLQTAREEILLRIRASPRSFCRCVSPDKCIARAFGSCQSSDWHGAFLKSWSLGAGQGKHLGVASGLVLRHRSHVEPTLNSRGGMASKFGCEGRYKLGD